MLKFPQAGLLLKLVSDAFLVTQSADSKTENRDGSHFRDELKELAKGKTLKNFKKSEGYLITQLMELDSTRFVGLLCSSWITFYRDFIATKNIEKLNSQELRNYLLTDACILIKITLRECWDQCYAPTNKIIEETHALWFLPDLKKNESGLALFFNWLESSHKLSRYQIAKNYDETKKSNSDEPGSALRSYWAKLSKTGEFGRANLQTFKKLEQAIWLSIKDEGLMDEKRLRLNLLLIKGFDYLFTELQKNFSKGELLNAINSSKNFSDWGENGFYLDDNRLIKLSKRTSVERKKKASDKKIAKELFDFFDKNMPSENLIGVVHWYRGRFYVLSGELEKGLDSYKKAFDNLQYVRGGTTIKKIISESLALTAFLGKDRRFFAEVYYYAALISLFDFPEEKELDYRFHQWSLAFNTYFLPHSYYSPASDKEKKYIEKGSWLKGGLIDDINKAADKKSKTNIFNTRPKSQLQSAIDAPAKTAEDVIKLIDDGVDVNFKDNSGGTALIEALQSYYGALGTNKNEKALKIINHLLKKDLSSSIDSVTKGKGISALSLAIDSFDIEMVESLINKGCNVAIKCHKPEMSYIYYILNCYISQKQMRSIGSPEDIYAAILQKNTSSNPAFGMTAQEQGNHHTQLLNETPRHQKIAKELLKCYQEINATEDNVVDLIKLFLSNNSSPNGHFINGLTPLMLATELGLTNVVILLLENGADTNAVNNCGKTALDYAIGYNRAEIKEVLDKNCSIISQSQSQGMNYLCT